MERRTHHSLPVDGTNAVADLRELRLGGRGTDGAVRLPASRVHTHVNTQVSWRRRRRHARVLADSANEHFGRRLHHVLIDELSAWNGATMETLQVQQREDS
jgi:hypothetical protein